MQRAKWTNPEVVIEYSGFATRKEGERCGGSISFSFSGSGSCDCVVPASCIRRAWVNRTARGSQ
eukprot:4217582-Lingulodinium_polyedra.AAC.1